MLSHRRRFVSKVRTFDVNQQEVDDIKGKLLKSVRRLGETIVFNVPDSVIYPDYHPTFDES